MVRTDFATMTSTPPTPNTHLFFWGGGYHVDPLVEVVFTFKNHAFRKNTLDKVGIWSRGRTRTSGWLRILFAPRNETMVELITFIGIYMGVESEAGVSERFPYIGVLLIGQFGGK